MTRHKYLIVLLLLVIVSACSEAKKSQPTQSLPDNPENRTMLAKRYLVIAPPGELMHGAADVAVKSFPEQDRKIFLDVMYSKALEEAMYHFELDKMVNKFTAKELQALVTYYGSPEGKSAQNKLGSLTMEILTHLQQEVKKAMEVAKKQQLAPSPQGPFAKSKSSHKALPSNNRRIGALTFIAPKFSQFLLLLTASGFFPGPCLVGRITSLRTDST